MTAAAFTNGVFPGWLVGCWVTAVVGLTIAEVVRRRKLRARRWIGWGGARWQAEYPVNHQREVGDLLVVLFDHMAYRDHGAPFQNLVAYDRTGRLAWRAALPRGTGADAYVSIEGTAPLMAYSWSGFRCTLDPATGRIVAHEFTK